MQGAIWRKTLNLLKPRSVAHLSSLSIQSKSSFSHIQISLSAQAGMQFTPAPHWQPWYQSKASFSVQRAETHASSSRRRTRRTCRGIKRYFIDMTANQGKQPQERQVIKGSKVSWGIGVGVPLSQGFQQEIYFTLNLLSNRNSLVVVQRPTMRVDSTDLVVDLSVDHRLANDRRTRVTIFCWHCVHDDVVLCLKYHSLEINSFELLRSVARITHDLYLLSFDERPRGKFRKTSKRQLLLEFYQSKILGERTLAVLFEESQFLEGDGLLHCGIDLATPPFARVEEDLITKHALFFAVDVMSTCENDVRIDRAGCSEAHCRNFVTQSFPSALYLSNKGLEPSS